MKGVVRKLSSLNKWLDRFADIERKTLESPICRLTFATQPPALSVLALPRCELHANCGWESSRRTRLAVTNRHRAKTGCAQRSHGHPIKKKKIFSSCCKCLVSAEHAERSALHAAVLLRRFSLPRSNCFLWLLPSRVMAPEQTVGVSGSG